ncbi:helix-turn-helix transcriptional regulator [Telmatocola sphagniphila]|uniref:Helix-turn-helix transcriptional regulator n=1 Tax=Telmatocola sphagniphila TaxID=1123043 RepID=A0A8E6EUZ0_9BACT|nr:helix-turn-helix domain-containing protein [Telmatocola sphagniphila]QVL34264.1 helix-turn-helix transcriptional regulator [Telmatocola sphagniphila]
MRKPHFNCPVQATINAIAGKWKVRIVWYLSFEDYGFARLRRKLKDVSEKVLIEQLKQLESDKIIVRTVRELKPLRVDYSLSEEGRALIPLMQQLCDWGSLNYGIKGTLPQPKKNVS